ncbi:hypothetical protein MMC25_006677 [Agyrium rufum]|nr:hypothetical protein [Agyrium rufum]
MNPFASRNYLCSSSSMKPAVNSGRNRVLLALSLPALFTSTMSSSKSTQAAKLTEDSDSAGSAGSQPSSQYPSYRYQRRHDTFPYSERDFRRQDETPDHNFYDVPRFVTHIDDSAIAALSVYYSHNLPKRGRILDLCSSWISHLPQEMEEQAVRTVQGKAGAADEEKLEVIGMGMNKRELDANPVLAARIVQDLNSKPDLPPDAEHLDATTCVVSIDYLTKPVEVLTSVRQHTKPGGQVHLAVSNRCFPTKAVGRWLRVGEQEKLNMVGDFLWFAGWREIEILTISDGDNHKGWGFSRPDSLWMVRGKNLGSEDGVD